MCCAGCGDKQAKAVKLADEVALHHVQVMLRDEPSRAFQATPDPAQWRFLKESCCESTAQLGALRVHRSTLDRHTFGTRAACVPGPSRFFRTRGFFHTTLDVLSMALHTANE